jgi:hypothetical protein
VNAVKNLLYFQQNGLDYRAENKRLRTWIETVSSILRDKLAQHGLIELPKRITAKEMWEKFIAQKGESTSETYTRTRDRFFTFFKDNELIADLTQDRILEWKKALKERYAEATVTGTLSKTQSAFHWAKKNRYLEENPIKTQCFEGDYFLLIFLCCIILKVET